MSIWFESKWPWKSNLEVKIDVLLVYFYYIRNNYIIFFPWFVLMNDWGLSVDNSFSTKDNCSAIGIPLYPTSGKYFCAAYEQGFPDEKFSLTLCMILFKWMYGVYHWQTRHFQVSCPRVWVWISPWWIASTAATAISLLNYRDGDNLG